MPTTLTRRKQPKRVAATQFSVDYPRQNEVITASRYTLRVSAPEGVRSVEVAMDSGDWQPCRQSVGYWWYDWSGYSDGEHEIITRIETQEGRRITSEPHQFMVNLQPKQGN